MLPLNRLWIELGAALLIIGIASGLWVHHDSVERNKGAMECQAKVTEAKSTANDEAKAREAARELQFAEAQKAHDDALRNLPPPVSTSVLLCKPGTTIRPSPPGSTSTSSGVHSPSGPADQGSGSSDIRPGIAAYELRYENVVADCNKLIQDWPR